MGNFGDLQNEIYLAGLSGVLPSLPMSFAELERRAELALPAGTWSYVAGGAGDEHTQRSNRTAFEHWGLVPRMLRASTERDLSAGLFDLSTSNFPQLRGRCLANYFSDPVFRSRLAKSPEEDPGTAILTWALMFGRPLNWDDLTWLRSLTRLPLVLKGICHPDDARRAVDAGIDGVYVSNHGGRQANGGLAAIDCLADVAAAVPGVPVLFDSGVRSGTDVVKALALGATMVGIGRPYVYGAALGGTDGIVHVLKTMLAEADLLMAVDGYPTVADLGPGTIRRC
jgi:isopentenyl diphosphate isomerase/L-lactate dehydrogenase-like FMN-dependent dehydrogenase